MPRARHLRLVRPAGAGRPGGERDAVAAELAREHPDALRAWPDPAAGELFLRLAAGIALERGARRARRAEVGPLLHALIAFCE